MQDLAERSWNLERRPVGGKAPRDLRARRGTSPGLRKRDVGLALLIKETREVHVQERSRVWFGMCLSWSLSTAHLLCDLILSLLFFALWQRKVQTYDTYLSCIMFSLCPLLKWSAQVGTRPRVPKMLMWPASSTGSPPPFPLAIHLRCCNICKRNLGLFFFQFAHCCCGERSGFF